LLSLSPLLLYLLVVLGQTVCVAAWSNLVLALLTMPLVILTNILYGLGFWRGLIIKIPLPPAAPEKDIWFETVPV
jgi:hypothetical protein